MKDYRVIVSTYVLVRAKNDKEARREFQAFKEAVEFSGSETMSEDLMLNSEVIAVTEESHE